MSVGINQATIRTDEFLPIRSAEIKEAESSELSNKIAENMLNTYLEMAETKNISMSILLELINKIIESSKELRSQVVFNQVDQTMATLELAQVVAASKKKTAEWKFGLNVAISSLAMTITSISAVRTAKVKTVKDKHISGGKASELTPQQRNDISAGLQQARTAKYNNISQVSQMANSIGKDGTEIHHASNVRQDEETQASKEAKQKHDEQLVAFIEALKEEHHQLLKLMEKITETSLVTNR